MTPFLLKKLDVAADPVLLFSDFAGRPGSVLLDSGMIMDGLSRYSFICTDPFLTITARGKRVEIRKENGGSRGIEVLEGNPLDIIGELMKQYEMNREGCPFPFTGGAAGFFAYDLGRQLEELPDIAEDDLGVPDCWLGFYDVVAAVDHVAGTVYLVSTGFSAGGTAGPPHRVESRLNWLEDRLLRGLEKTAAVGGNKGSKPGRRPQDSTGLVPGFDRPGYCSVVQRARDYIAAGDIFQVNLSQRFSLSRQEDPWTIYRRLRQINPAPMAAFINCGDLQVACASPERFLKVSGRMVETRPIKGTRPRGKTPEEDRQMRDELWRSEKDRAELVMIVDLERNDLGRVCVPGSVQVPELYRLEEHPTVFHLVSTVTGRLEEGKGITGLLKASFPGGSITGAPKIRAMEIIEELEPVRRGLYCGSIGYLAFNGDADLNIVIRTLVCTPDKIYFQVGGGITIDSDPLAEFKETLDKGRALAKSLGLSNF